MKSVYRCGFCGSERSAELSRIRRAERDGAPLYCDRKCSGLARRKGKSVTQKKAEKRDYDLAYRQRNAERLRAKKAAHYKRTADREKERAIRQKNMPRHVEYCRQPVYRAKKRVYDEARRSRQYGPFAECHRILIELHNEIVRRVPSYYERHADTIKARTARQKRERVESE